MAQFTETVIFTFEKHDKRVEVGKRRIVSVLLYVYREVIPSRIAYFVSSAIL